MAVVLSYECSPSTAAAAAGWEKLTLLDSRDSLVQTNHEDLIIGDLLEPSVGVQLLEVEDDDDLVADEGWAELLVGFQRLFDDEEEYEIIDFAPSFGVRPRTTLFPVKQTKPFQAMDAISNLSERYLISTFFGDGIKHFDPPLQCPICLEDFEFEDDPILTLERCGHFLCVACMKQSIHDFITRSKEPGCPMHQCNHQLTEREFTTYALQNDIVSYDRAFIWQRLQAFACPGGCYQVFTMDEATELQPCNASVDCLTCATLICGTCKSEAHPDSPCPEHRQLNLLEFLVEAADDLGLQWTSCPVCKQAILRTDGCNHITCRCKKQFCFYCRRNWNGTSAHHDECPVKKENNNIFAKGSFPLYLLRSLPSDPVAWETYGASTS